MSNRRRKHVSQSDPDSSSGEDDNTMTEILEKAGLLKNVTNSKLLSNVDEYKSDKQEEWDKLHGLRETMLDFDPTVLLRDAGTDTAHKMIMLRYEHLYLKRKYHSLYEQAKALKTAVDSTQREALALKRKELLGSISLLYSDGGYRKLLLRLFLSSPFPYKTIKGTYVQRLKNSGVDHKHPFFATVLNRLLQSLKEQKKHTQSTLALIDTDAFKEGTFEELGIIICRDFNSVRNTEKGDISNACLTVIAWLDSLSTDAGCCWCEHLENIKLPQQVQDEIPSAYVSLCHLFHSTLIEARDQKLMTYPLRIIFGVLATTVARKTSSGKRKRKQHEAPLYDFKNHEFSHSAINTLHLSLIEDHLTTGYEAFVLLVIRKFCCQVKVEEGGINNFHLYIGKYLESFEDLSEVRERELRMLSTYRKQAYSDAEVAIYESIYTTVNSERKSVSKLDEKENGHKDIDLEVVNSVATEADNCAATKVREYRLIDMTDLGLRDIAEDNNEDESDHQSRSREEQKTMPLFETTIDIDNIPNKFAL